MSRITSVLATLLACTLGIALLVGAFVVGTNHRCDTLRAQHAPTYEITRYC